MEEKGAPRAGLNEDGVPEADVKIILLGDSAVGKSKLVERYLMDEYQPRQLSTYALTLFRKESEIDGKNISVDFWDTAGQERFASMHPSYYFRAHACIMVFDVTRKNTYQNLATWYSELRQYCETIPVILVANKIDVDYKVTKKSFKFSKQHDLPFFFVSAADGTNVVKVFQEATRMALEYKQSGGGDFVSEVMQLLDGGVGEVQSGRAADSKRSTSGDSSGASGAKAGAKHDEAGDDE